MRRLGKTTMFALLVVLVVLSVYYWLLPWQGNFVFPLEQDSLELTDKDKVLVFAPHPDDESIGTAGFIQKAIAADSRVTVVFLTCGDGFRQAALRQFRVVRTNANSMLALGKVRQQEAWSATSLLGVPAENVVFLGYPDRGLARLWQQHWSITSSYQSPYTGTNFSPYSNGFTPVTAYSGEALLKDIKTILRTEKPTVILFPSNYEGHSDHWATNAFVAYALEDLRLHGWACQPKAYNYLVHYHDWPRPWGAHVMRALEPPAAIADQDEWLSLPLSWSERVTKQNAILKHRSQIAVMRGFLTAFVRSTELFQVYPSAVVLESTNSGEQMVLASDAAGDSLIDRFDRHTDIVRLSGCVDAKNLQLTLSLRGPVKPELKCKMELVTLGGTVPELRLQLSIPAKELPTGITVSSSGNNIILNLERGLLGEAPLLFVSAETYQGQTRADRLRQIKIQLK